MITVPELLSIQEDQAITIFVPIVDDMLASEELQLSIGSNQPSLIREDDISLKPIEGGVELSIRPVFDQFGTVFLTLEVSDSVHTVRGIIPTEVLPVADSPRITSLSDISVEGHAPYEIEIQISDPDTPLTELRLILESNFEELIPVDKESITLVDAQTSISLTPRQGQFGIAEITLRVQALDGLFTEERFQVQVTDPMRENTPPVNLRMQRGPDGVLESLFLSWIGEMDVYVADQLLGPFRLLEGVSSPFQPPVEPDGKF